jgi:hypothetical protein
VGKGGALYHTNNKNLLLFIGIDPAGGLGETISEIPNSLLRLIGQT